MGTYLCIYVPFTAIYEALKLEAPGVENKGLQCVYSQCGHGNGIGD